MTDQDDRARADRAAATLAASFGAEPIEPAAKAGAVRAVFDRVAGRYDLMNDLMSGGVHRLWKEALVDWLVPRPGRHYVDVAGGTGDIAFRILDRLERLPVREGRPAPSHPTRMTLIDINAAMLARGRDRALDAGRLSGLTFVVGDAMRLPLRDASVDAVTLAFGIRNVTHIDQALGEVRRVLRPGGRFLCLEFSRVVLPVLDRLYDAYTDRVLPALGRVVAGDAAAYRYLAQSIRRFPDQATFTTLIEAAGLARVKHRNLSGGIAALHSAWRL